MKRDALAPRTESKPPIFPTFESSKITWYNSGRPHWNSHAQFVTNSPKIAFSSPQSANFRGQASSGYSQRASIEPISREFIHRAAHASQPRKQSRDQPSNKREVSRPRNRRSPVFPAKKNSIYLSGLAAPIAAAIRRASSIAIHGKDVNGIQDSRNYLRSRRLFIAVPLSIECPLTSKHASATIRYQPTQISRWSFVYPTEVGEIDAD